MNELRIEATRGDLVESVHLVSVAVADADGSLVAAAGDAELRTFWRSAAKPFQALPLVEDGAADAFGLTDEELALCCASHSSEPVHLALTDGFLHRIGCAESDLACGPHAPLGAAVAERVARSGESPTPRWSNCSGKHAGMLALARHHGWPTHGYERAGHPVQERILREVARWTGMAPGAIELAVDGCTAVCFGLPLHAMATAYARLAASNEPAVARVRAAMLAHPAIVAGEGRYCTDLMRALPGAVIAKVGAEGVYSAALIGAGLGVALKVQDGDMRSAPVALAAVLQQLCARHAPALAAGLLDGPAGRYAEPAARNTRGEVTGVLRATGTLRFFDASRAGAVSARALNGVQ